MNKILDAHVQELHSELDVIVTQIETLTNEVRNEELIRTVSDLKLRLDEPFLFVIVGEVKSGKSSFINALLGTGEEITAVGPQPLTDTIQQIKYGEEYREEVVNEYYKKIYVNIPILQDISIVDTPGTNTIIDHHQEITERFVPVSDMIVFVFEAKNPYRQSSWDFFNYIHEEWKKKVIFVLQQKDLVAPDALQVNHEGVVNYAKERGISDPKVFDVSALEEENGDPNSGFGELKDYISHNITGGQAPLLKLENIADTSSTIVGRLENGLADREKQYEADKAFRNDIKQTLDEQQEYTEKQVDNLVENLLSGYDRVTEDTKKELKSGLSFVAMVTKSFKSLVSKQESPKVWLDGLRTDLEKNLNIELKDQLSDGVGDIADSIQNMAKMIDLKLQQNRTVLPDNHDLFGHIAENRRKILEEVRESFSKFLKNNKNFEEGSLVDTSDTIAPDIATGSGIAIVGIILTALTNGMIFDITGGILTTFGLAFAGITAGLNRRKIIKTYDSEIEAGRNTLRDDLTTKLDEYVDGIRVKIEENFQQFDDLLEKEKSDLQEFRNRVDDVNRELENVQVKIDKELESIES